MRAVDSMACYEEKLAYERLERLQQRRKGEPVLPSLNVNVAGTHSTM